MRLAWTPEAVADREAIFDYIEADSPRAAIALDERFERRAAELLEHSMIGRIGRVAQTRELVIRPSYVLVYDLAGDTIRILRVLHAARQWPPPA